MAEWRSRIVEQGTIDPHLVQAHVRNWRSHPASQRRALEAALNEIGWVQSVVVNKRTGRLIDGHLRVAAALDRGESVIPVTYVELTDDEELLALATVDSITRMAGTDEDALSSLLEDLVVSEPDLRAFLDDITPRIETDYDDEPVVPRPNPDSVDIPGEEIRQLVINVTPGQRDVIMRAITAAAGEDEQATPGEALADVCSDFLARLNA